LSFEEKIKDVLVGKICESSVDKNQLWIRVLPSDIAPVLKDLRDNPEFSFDFLTDICGVDNFPSKRRFEVVYHLLSTKNKFRLRIKVQVPEDTMMVPSSVSVWKGANWMEREVYDMYGIKFEGHPDLRRILMHEDFKDFPQRKDFPLKGWRHEAD